MTQNNYQLPLTFEQILTLVKQLPRSEQIKLTREIDRHRQTRRSTFGNEFQTTSHHNTKEQPIHYRTETFRHLMEQVEPVDDFDSQQAKEDYLKEKYSL